MCKLLLWYFRLHFKDTCLGLVWLWGSFSLNFDKLIITTISVLRPKATGIPSGEDVIAFVKLNTFGQSFCKKQTKKPSPEPAFLPVCLNNQIPMFDFTSRQPTQGRWEPLFGFWVGCCLFKTFRAEPFSMKRHILLLKLPPFFFFFNIKRGSIAAA